MAKLNSQKLLSKIQKPYRVEKSLIDDNSYSSFTEWWGMPSFQTRDARPYHRLVVQFLTQKDMDDFSKLIGNRVFKECNSIWYPIRKQISRRKYSYSGGKNIPNRYPICIPSKGRWKYQKTVRCLEQLQQNYFVFVEETERKRYIRQIGKDRVISMPFHDLGRGSIPARNFIWDWCLERGYRRHWVVDDNIRAFVRLNCNRRLCVYRGGFFRAMEDFVDRYENIGLAGPHGVGLINDQEAKPPFLLNSRVYSCILIDSSLPFRWRGKFNEDTDLSLRVLKQGLCTLLFHVFLMNKTSTVGVRNCKPLPGGNTDNVYNTKDSRLAFAKSLQKGIQIV